MSHRALISVQINWPLQDPDYLGFCLLSKCLYQSPSFWKQLKPAIFAGCCKQRVSVSAIGLHEHNQAEKPVCSLPDVDSTNLDDYNIHVIASVLKQWLRDLPNPLLTFELYEEFIRAMCKRSDFLCFGYLRTNKASFRDPWSGQNAGVCLAGLQEKKETIRGVYSVIDQLSRTHLNTLERLVFHLVR